MPRRFDVVVSPVREVSLIGFADLAYWREKLTVHRLHPKEVDGRAEMLLSSCEARFRGVRFREFLVAVFVTARPGGGTRDGVFLVRAFNSLRFFAWFERTMFRTPYFPQRVTLSPESPAFMRLGPQDRPIVLAAMSPARANDSVEPSAAVADGWQGPIFLPDLRDATAASSHLFYGSLTGDTRTFAFDPNQDTFQLGAPVGELVVETLIAARFSPSEWSLRTSATHGKSKTIGRVSGQEFTGFANGKMCS
jgi:hypothetical protein